MSAPTSPRQQPLGSPFGAGSTASEVLAGHDLTGRTVLVTGGYAGIGTAITRALTDAGARVLAPARRPEVARDALAGCDGVEIGTLDLADQGSVAGYVAGLVADGVRLDAVINNAGIMALPETRTPQGWEMQLATNHLGHFALTVGMWSLLADGARVVSVSSAGHYYSPIRWDDPWFEDGYDKWLAYGQSKTANALFAVEADRRGRGRGIRAFSVHPGAILTTLGRHLTADDVAALLEPDEHGNVAIPEFKSPEQGAATAVWAAVSPLLADRGGEYLVDCDVAPLAAVDEAGGSDSSGVKPYAVDRTEAARLWEWSEQVTGVTTAGAG
ncbi:oxidoreductase [Nocardioides sp. R-C-SC26]|uniref:oxidoreductase n=1 Tax=Nocardioides sp. R-C-SC26 TaxID=2870414 RepID=UPI001E4410F7|nr:oxidoreductase [Nocardioides sp. R-C-SC26]